MMTNVNYKIAKRWLTMPHNFNSSAEGGGPAVSEGLEFDKQFTIRVENLIHQR